MCLLFLLVLAIYTIVVVFFGTARMLLPWTISATVLAGLAGLGIRKLMAPSTSSRVAASSTFVLTIVLGYLGFLLIPPTPPPPIPPKQGLEGLVEVMTELPKPDFSKEDLWQMLPIHLVIAGCIGALCVSSNVPTRWTGRENRPERKGNRERPPE